MLVSTEICILNPLFTLTGCFNLLVVILLLLEVQARLPQAGAQLPLVASFAGNESLKNE
jgi:hypothetical protein